MAVAIKQQRSIAKVSTHQLEYSLQKRKLLNVLDYVLVNLYELKISNDSRASTYKQVEAEKGAERAKTLRDDFCSMFGSGNLGIVTENDPLCSKNPSASASKPTTSTTTDSASTTTNLGIYKPSKNPYTLTVQGIAYSISVLPSSAYPNLNALTSKSLSGYFQYLGLSRAHATKLAGVIKDWSDEDDFTQENGGAEWGTYSQGENPYKPRNAPIKTWQELNFLLHAEPELVTLIRQHFILSGSEKVDYQYVNSTQISALANVNKEIVDKWLSNKDDTIDSKYKKRLDSVVYKGLSSSHEDVVIKITTGKIILLSWFNVKDRKLQEWSFIQEVDTKINENINFD